MYHFLEQYDVLYENQFGFKTKHSTIDAVTKFATDVSLSLENKQSTLAVYLDLLKAFDTIDHSILLRKLLYYGVRDQALNWFRTYLLNRKQFVNHREFNSSIKTIECGVPQGFVLGPLLFIIYANDLPNFLNVNKTILFGDDTAIYLSGYNLNHLYTTMNLELEQLTNWFRANKLYVIFIFESSA